ncbi:MAG: diguanylate cyclase domain-containing protein [Caulobacterales bacterium]
MLDYDPDAPDALTGLLTRRLFRPPAEALLGSVDARPLALILVDIDHCKRFNGCHGHRVGDALIVQVGQGTSDA